MFYLSTSNTSEVAGTAPTQTFAKKLRQLQESIGEHDNVGFDIYVFEYVEYASICLGTRRYINANEGEVQC